MFDLEQAISEWRQQMLAAGIKSPVPLEELESHLREEIEEQVQLGTGEQQAFEIAVRQMGRADSLKIEFRNVGFLNWWGEDPQTRINRIFALFWLASCSWGFFSVVRPFLSLIFGKFQGFSITPGFLLIFILGIIFLRGIVASIRLFGGNHKEIRLLYFMAILGFVALAGQIIRFKTLPPLGFVWAAFNVASLILLRSPSRKNQSTATK